MNFADRNHIFRKSLPGDKNDESKERTKTDDKNTIDFIKRRGASLARPDFNRNDSLNYSRDQSSKRNSDLDSIRFDSSQSGSTKLLSIFKSGFHLSKVKSKSKINLQDKRQSYNFESQSSKSEENLSSTSFECYLKPIRVSNILLNDNNPILYTNTFSSEGDSFYRELVVLDKNCSIQPIHPSIVSGEKYCFQILKMVNPRISHGELTGYKSDNEFSFGAKMIKPGSDNSPLQTDVFVSITGGPVAILRCQSSIQRNEWIMKLKRHINPDLDQIIRHEDHLKIWIQDAKHLLAKNRYFCEIFLDDVLYGRTASKSINNTVFWGEEFEFTGLNAVKDISINVYRTTDTKKKRDKPEQVATIHIPTVSLHQNSFTEKWFPCLEATTYPDHQVRNTISKVPAISRDDNELLPTVRIKARYRSLKIIPTYCYQALLDCLVEDNISLVTSLEGHLKVKYKEEFINTFLMVLKDKKIHLSFLADVIIMEVNRADPNVLFRGNSIASKAIECYMKIIGEKYLTVILSDFVAHVTIEELDCEVDPLRLQSIKDMSLISFNQKKLLGLVDTVWNKIYTNCHLLPNDLKSVFSMIREQLVSNRSAHSNTSSQVDQVISSCLFLRFICPAIMSPFLFGLTEEYSDKPAINRTFTLVAKCIQSLANFSHSYQGKEAYMGFMQTFLSLKTTEMRNFIMEISKIRRSLQFTNQLVKSDNNESIENMTDLSMGDLSYNLADLTYQLSFHLRDIPIQAYTPSLMKIRSVLESISSISPRVHSEEDNRSYNSYLPTNHCTRILTRKSSASPSLTLNNLDIMRSTTTNSSRYSNTPRADIDNEFSSLPRGLPKTDRYDYVDFESMDVKFQEESSREMFIKSPRILNEKEINDNWSEVVKQSLIMEPPTTAEFMPDCLSSIWSTQNSNLGKSLSLSLSQKSSQPAGQFKNNITQEFHHQKVTPIRQSNITQRIQRNSNLTRLKTSFSEIETTDASKLSSSTISFSVDSSYDRQVSKSEGGNNNVERSQSGPLVYRTQVSNESNIICSSIEQSDGDYSSSFENLQSSNSSVYSRKNQPLSNPISYNIDLDSFISNELARLELFFKYFKVPIPVMYQCNEIEQLDKKRIDENCLKNALLMTSEMNRDDILNYIRYSYRLLKSITKPGDTTPDVIIKSVMEINQRIQSLLSNDFQRRSLSTVDKDTVTKSAQSKSNTAPSSIPPRSIPSPLSKFSKQSHQFNLIYLPSSEINSNANMTKTVAVTDPFERF